LSFLLCSVVQCFGEDAPAGVGVALSKKDGKIIVLKVLPGTPAEKDGQVHEGDVIVGIAEEEGKAVRPDEIGSAVRMLKGKKGTMVKVTIVPAGKTEADARVVTIVRGSFKLVEQVGDGKLLEAGSDAPDATLVELSGDGTQKLSDYRGKVVVLSFWATWCGPCQVEMAELQQLVEKHPEWKDKVVVISASVDEKKEDAARRIKEKGWDKTRNFWVENSVLWAYHVDAFPTCYVIDGKGRVVTTDARDLSAVVGRVVERTKSGEPADK
jgi:thiol-disulfide isomerase/thioredoxin